MEVRTGEAVAISYELAGLGSRFLAVVIDGIAQLLILLAVTVAGIYGLRGLGRLIPSANLQAVVIAAGVVLLFVVGFGWFVAFETWWAGRTPGKRALGLRVVRDGGFPVDWGASVIRNLVRIVEFALGFYALSAVSALLSAENKRLGDFAAGTIVVRDRAEAPDIDAYLASTALSPLPPEERLLVERFLARRANLDGDARIRLAARIAERVRPFAPADAPAGDEDLLMSLVRGA